MPKTIHGELAAMLHSNVDPEILRERIDTKFAHIPSVAEAISKLRTKIIRPASIDGFSTNASDIDPSMTYERYADLLLAHILFISKEYPTKKGILPSQDHSISDDCRSQIDAHLILLFKNPDGALFSREPASLSNLISSIALEKITRSKQVSTEIFTENDAHLLNIFAYLNGVILKENGVKAIEALALAAERGDARSQYILGKYNYPQDTPDEEATKTALEFWKASAAQGFAPAKCELGSHYYRNDDIERGLLLWEEASDLGYAPAKYELGCHRKEFEGDEIEKSASKLFEEAAAQGYPPAQYELGLLYAKEVEKTAEAVELFRQSSNSGYAQAQHEYGKFLYGNGEEEKALELWRLSAEQGYDDAKESIITHSTARDANPLFNMLGSSAVGAGAGAGSAGAEAAAPAPTGREFDREKFYGDATAPLAHSVATPNPLAKAQKPVSPEALTALLRGAPSPAASGGGSAGAGSPGNTPAPVDTGAQNKAARLMAALAASLRE